MQDSKYELWGITDISQVTGRILIDHFGYKKHFEGLQRSDSSNRKKRLAQQPPPPSGGGNGAKYVQTLPKEQQEENRKEMLGRRKDELVYVSPLLEGFALKNKQWRKSKSYRMSIPLP